MYPILCISTKTTNMMVNTLEMPSRNDIYYNEFFEGVPKLSADDLAIWMKEHDRMKMTFAEHPTVNNLTRWDVWKDRAKFYFLPFLMNCYKFTRQHELPHFAIPVSPTCMFYRDRLHLRNFMDTVHQTFFEALDMCIPKNESIMLMVEKRFHVVDPIDGGTQQLYNMLWDYDMSAITKGNRIENPKKVLLPPNGTSTTWNLHDLNPDVPMSGIDLCRRTCWLQDDFLFLCKRYDFVEQKSFPEIVDLTNVSEEKWDIYKKTAREFHFAIFEPKDVSEDVEVVSSESELDDLDSTDMELDSTQMGLLDSTLDFEEEDDKMNKIIAFFAKMPKVTGLVQGMVDMMESLARILPLVIVKLDDEKLKGSLTRTVDIINLGLGKVLKLCAYLGIKVEKKPNGAIGEIVKNRFKKDKKDFLEYEIDELNKSLDALEKVDEEPPPPPKGQIPLDVKPNHLYPQRMPLGPKPPPPIVVPPEPPPVDVKPDKPAPPPKPPKPPAPPSKPSSDQSELAKPEPPPPPPPPKKDDGKDKVKPEPSKPDQGE